MKLDIFISPSTIKLKKKKKNNSNLDHKNIFENYLFVSHPQVVDLGFEQSQK